MNQSYAMIGYLSEQHESYLLRIPQETKPVYYKVLQAIYVKKIVWENKKIYYGDFPSTE